MENLHIWIKAQENAIGSGLIAILDWQTSGIIIVVFLIILSLLSRAVCHHFSSTEEHVKCAIALGSIFAAIGIVCVLILTDPPAINKLSDSDRVIVGIISAVILFLLGFKEIHSVFFKTTATTAAVTHPAPAASPTRLPPAPHC